MRVLAHIFIVLALVLQPAAWTPYRRSRGEKPMACLCCAESGGCGSETNACECAEDAHRTSPSEPPKVEPPRILLAVMPRPVEGVLGGRLLWPGTCVYTVKAAAPRNPRAVLCIWLT